MPYDNKKIYFEKDSKKDDRDMLWTKPDRQMDIQTDNSSITPSTS